MAATFSSSLPYRAGSARFLIGAMPDFKSPPLAGKDEFERLHAAAATDRLVFKLAVATVGGQFHPIADLRVGARLSDDVDALHFNPWNTCADLEPAGWLNAARYRSYQLSQRAWQRTQAHHAAPTRGRGRVGAPGAWRAAEAGERRPSRVRRTISPQVRAKRGTAHRASVLPEIVAGAPTSKPVTGTLRWRCNPHSRHPGIAS